MRVGLLELNAETQIVVHPLPLDVSAQLHRLPVPPEAGPTERLHTAAGDPGAGIPPEGGDEISGQRDNAVVRVVEAGCADRQQRTVR
jgi:hypothetical protein